MAWVNDESQMRETLHFFLLGAELEEDQVDAGGFKLR